MSKTSTWATEGLSRIQTLVDALSDTLGRSVAVDNPSFELVCASAQIGPIDERRIAAIIDRAPPQEPVPWMLSYGIAVSHTPVRLPANGEYGMLPRVCFPIRGDGLLGYLWLFDEPRVSNEDIGTTSAVVRQLAQILHHEDVAAKSRAEDIRVLTEQAVSTATATKALEHAAAREYLPGDGHLEVLVLRTAQAVDGRQGAAARDPQLELSRSRIGRPYLVRAAPGRLTIVARNRHMRDNETLLSGVKRLLRTTDAVVETVGSAASGSPMELERALYRAQFAADLAAMLGRERLDWEQTGSWRLLLGKPLTEETVEEVSQDASQLLRNGTPEQRKTLLAYLDSGRSVQATAQALTIHRATLHYRLERIREVIGTASIDDGWRTVSLHVALKLHDALQSVDRGGAERRKVSS